ncbi:nuclear transport factor 2 family protein [Streptomyces sp. PDY-4]|uniref:nuclear transport factor 2 family protein n=1 Tax=Streptomyces TaxID=1883 RepID=UPI0013CF052C|nr:nuclear transport factor 2 family protein [Streptomyces fungicidicus]
MTPPRLLRGAGTRKDTPSEALPAPGPDSGPGHTDTSTVAGAPAGGASGGSADQPDADADEGDGVGVPGRWGRGGRLRGVLLGGLAALLVAGGCGFLYGAHQLESDGAARNRALTDTEATDRVAGEVGNALARVFSYTPDGTAAAERSARTVLGGRAARQYQDLFGQVRDDLTEQRVTLSTRAVRTGVIELDGDRARLLVFLDQTSRRGDDAATTAAAQLTVTARLENDRWLIVDLKAR